MNEGQNAQRHLASQVARLAKVSEEASIQSEVVGNECRRTIAMSKTASRIGEVARLLSMAEKARKDLLIGSKILPECLEK